MIPNMAVEVRGDDVLVLMTKVHHFFLDACCLIIENYYDNSHQVTVFEFLVFNFNVTRYADALVTNSVTIRFSAR